MLYIRTNLTKEIRDNLP